MITRVSDALPTMTRGPTAALTRLIIFPHRVGIPGQTTPETWELAGSISRRIVWSRVLNRWPPLPVQVRTAS